MPTTINNLLLGFFGLLVAAGCGPTFDPGSLVTNARVLGARTEVEGAPDRATPRPGETATVTWLVTAPEVMPLTWTFGVCAPAAGTTWPACRATALVRADGDASPPRISIPVPSEDVLDGATSLTLHGGICAGVDSTLELDARSGLVGCTNGGRGTTVSLVMPLQRGDDANHNPAADRTFTFDGAAWPLPAAADDPCAQGPQAAAGSKGHVIGYTTEGSDREPYTAVSGDPPAPTPTRESLQISQFTTAGKLKSQFSFVEAADPAPTTTLEVTWDAPEVDEASAVATTVTFTFVVRDDRGGTDWTTRTLCVTP